MPLPHILHLFVSFPFFSTLSLALLSLLVLSGTCLILRSLESGILLVRKHWVLECWAGALGKITILVCFSSTVTAMEVSACPASLYPAWCLSRHFFSFFVFSSSLMRGIHICEVSMHSRDGSIPRFQYWSDTTNSEYLQIPISIRYSSFFYISVEFLYLSVCWPAHHSFYTQSTKYRQLYCKEKQQINGYVIIIYDKNSFIN